MFIGGGEGVEKGLGGGGGGGLDENGVARHLDTPTAACYASAAAPNPSKKKKKKSSGSHFLIPEGG